MRKRSKVRNLEDYKQKKSNEKDRQKNHLKKKKTKNKRKIKFFSMVSLFIISMMLFLMYRYSIISNLKYEVQSLNKELENMKNKKKELYLELEKLSKSGFVEKEAREKLQMDYPTEDQIVYIKID